MNRQWDIGDLYLLLLIGGYFLFVAGSVYSNFAIAVLGVFVVVLLLIALVLVTLQDFDIIDIGMILEQRRQRMREYHISGYEPIPEGVLYGSQGNYGDDVELGQEQECEKDMDFDEHRFYYGW